MQIFIRTQKLVPEVPVEEIFRQRFDEHSGLEPNQVLVGVFGDQDNTSKEQLPM